MCTFRRARVCFDCFASSSTTSHTTAYPHRSLQLPLINRELDIYEIMHVYYILLSALKLFYRIVWVTAIGSSRTAILYSVST